MQAQQQASRQQREGHNSPYSDRAINILAVLWGGRAGQGISGGSWSAGAGWVGSIAGCCGVVVWRFGGLDSLKSVELAAGSS